MNPKERKRLLLFFLLIALVVSTALTAGRGVQLSTTALATPATQTTVTDPSTASLRVFLDCPISSQVVTVVGSGFQPSENVTVGIPGIVSIPGVTSSSGDFEVSFLVPPGTPPGTYTMSAVGVNDGASTVFTLGCLTVRFVTAPAAELPPTVFHRTGFAIADDRVNVNLQTLTVEVDQSSQPVQSATVHVSEISINDGNVRSTGPNDGTVRPHAWLYPLDNLGNPQPGPGEPVPSMDTFVAQNAVGGSTDTNGINLTTNNAGQATFGWLPPEIAGTETITVSVSNHPEVTPATASINVKVDGLEEIPKDDQLYRLVGNTTQDTGQNPVVHPLSHSATASTTQDLIAIAQDYISIQQGDTALQGVLRALLVLGYQFGAFPTGRLDLLEINDISLPWGGLFDACPQVTSACPTAYPWASPHGGHRWGNQADIRTSYLVGNPNHPLRTVLGDPNAPFPINRLVSLAQLAMFHDLMSAIHAVVDPLAPQGASILVEANHLHVTFPS
jgi:hypothetical protein